MPISGERRFRSTSTASAFSGETYTTRTPASPVGGENINRSTADKKAASVFPDPVGASNTVDSP